MVLGSRSERLGPLACACPLIRIGSLEDDKAFLVAVMSGRSLYWFDRISLSVTKRCRGSVGEGWKPWWA